MYAKKLPRRKCGVRGCKNIETYALSLTREMGNSVIICKSCLEKAVKAVDDIKPIPDARVPHEQAPPLFFNAAVRKADAEQSEEPADGVIEELTEQDVEQSEEPAEYICPHCGQVCKSELGLQKHIAAKHKDVM